MGFATESICSPDCVSEHYYCGSFPAMVRQKRRVGRREQLVDDSHSVEVRATRVPSRELTRL
ncbi:hypothetical protein CR51_15195 [Caballeronia megalochromosomata]|nr:hypothetical protein CR51_15195 [Caballeronia megalochromosomata]